MLLSLLDSLSKHDEHILSEAQTSWPPLTICCARKLRSLWSHAFSFKRRPQWATLLSHGRVRHGQTAQSSHGKDISTIYLFGCDMVLDWVEQEAQVAGCRSTSEAERYQGRKRKRENKGKWSLDLLSKQLQARCMIWTWMGHRVATTFNYGCPDQDPCSFWEETAWVAWSWEEEGTCFCLASTPRCQLCF